MIDYDITVIGAGPGGYTAAIRATQLGAKVALIEQEDVGGTCINKGCIPTKSLIYNVEAYESILKMNTLGINVTDVSIDVNKVLKRKHDIVTKLRNNLINLIRLNKIDLFKGKGVLRDNLLIEVIGDDNDNKLIRTNKVILAMGSTPMRIPIKGVYSDDIITSDEALNLSNIPAKMVIIGGGVIGMEMATIFSGLGSKVTILEMMDDILPMIDREVVSVLKDSFRQKDIEIVTSAHVDSIEKISDVKIVKYSHDNQIKSCTADAILMATGRLANTKNMDLEKLGITMERDKISVNDKMQTNLPGVYAIGDVIGGIQLAHVAMMEGLIAAENALGAQKKVDYNAIPSCIYTNPEIAGVGMTEEQAKTKGYDVIIGKYPISYNGRAMTMNESTGLVKIIAERQYGGILGAYIIGPNATEMISELTLSINMEATLDELKYTIHPHPSIAECIFEAAHDANNECIHQPPKRESYKTE